MDWPRFSDFLTHLDTSKDLAGREGIEPSVVVLEATGLPLTDRPISGSGGRYRTLVSDFKGQCPAS